MTGELLLQNPWWEDAKRIQSDIHLQQIQNLPFQYRPEVVSSADLSRSGVMTLRGPRPVGKTTYVKMLIDQLLRQGVAAKRILYYNTELVANERELFDLCRDFFGHRGYRQALRFPG